MIHVQLRPKPIPPGPRLSRAAAMSACLLPFWKAVRPLPSALSNHPPIHSSFMLTQLQAPLRANPTQSDLQFYIFFRALCFLGVGTWSHLPPSHTVPHGTTRFRQPTYPFTWTSLHPAGLRAPYPTSSDPKNLFFLSKLCISAVVPLPASEASRWNSKKGQELPTYGVNLHLPVGLAFPRLWLRLAPGINPEMVIKNLHE